MHTIQIFFSPLFLLVSELIFKIGCLFYLDAVRLISLSGLNREFILLIKELQSDRSEIFELIGDMLSTPSLLMVQNIGSGGNWTP